MKCYAGMDVSLDSVSVCVVDAAGKVWREAKVTCEPDALVAWFRALEHLLLQIRTRVLDGTLRPLFERWYPSFANDNTAADVQAAAA